MRKVIAEMEATANNTCHVSISHNQCEVHVNTNSAVTVTVTVTVNVTVTILGSSLLPLLQGELNV
jgi:hypothetical protein